MLITAQPRIVCCVLMLVMQSSARSEEMRFLLRDGSRIDGTLQPCDQKESIAIQTDVLSQPVLVRSDQLLQASTLKNQPGRQTDPQASSAFHLTDDSWLIGNVESVQDDRIKIRTDAFGIVSFATGDLVRMVPVGQVPRRLATLANSCWKLNRRLGWNFTQRKLVADKPVASVVVDWELPERFRMVVKARCDGNPDLEWTLGDRSVDLTGQGRGGVQHKGGSLSRLPTERFVTRMEWFGNDVTLVRSDPSVSDAATFMTPAGTLDVELFCDQRQGILVAFSQGREVARAVLIDSDPKLRDQLTLIHRGDAIAVEQLDLFQWDGAIPTSNDRGRPFVRRRDGQETSFDLQRLNEPNAASDLIAVHTGNSVNRSASLELQLADGTRLMGTLAGREQQQMLLTASGGRRFRVEPERITAVRVCRDSYSDDTDQRGRAGRSWLTDGRTRLSGDWDVDDEPRGLTWRRGDEAGGAKIISKPGVAIESPIGPATDSTQSFVGLQLVSGDRAAGRLLRWTGDRLTFQSVFGDEVNIPAKAVSRLILREHQPVDPAALDWVLRLPRRQTPKPPSHLIVSVDGDVLRGKVIAIDAESARIEIRDRVRLIAVDRIAEMIALATTSPETATVAYQIETADGSSLGFESITGDESVVRADHAVFGVCTIERAEIKRIDLQPDRAPPKVPEWNPMKKPRSDSINSR